MPWLARFTLLLTALLTMAGPLRAQDPAPTPPMGWNSWDAYAFSLDEPAFKANAAVVEQLKPYGWSYVVIDEGWYMENPFGDRLETRKYRLNANGLLIPVESRFPSAAGGAGFKPLADWTHARGLKFGIHIVRGVPKAAVQGDLPIAGSAFHASEAADREAVCPWDDANYGVKDNAAGQAYYDSMLKLYAGWGLDFIKVDCIADHPYRGSEIQQIARAIRKTGRPIVLSLSPGPASLANVGELGADSQMWRIADDLWDGWTFPHTDPKSDFPNGVRSAFDTLAKWNPYVRPGNWPDADMLPFGSLRPHAGWGEPRQSRLTQDEARTQFTLWAIARSPLILGGDLTKTDAFTRSLLTNRAVIALNQKAANSHPATNLPPGFDQVRVWVSAGGAHPDRPDVAAVFNLDGKPLTLKAKWSDLGLAPGAHAARDLWSGVSLARAETIEVEIPAHGVALYRID